MGFSTSGATVILFIGLLVSVGIVYPPVERSFEAVTGALDDRDDRMLQLRNSDVAVTNVTYDSTTDALNVTVDNTGTVSLAVEETDLLVNGTLVTTYTTTVGGTENRSLWGAGETLKFRVSGVTNEPARVTVVTELGLRRVATDVTVVS